MATSSTQVKHGWRATFRTLFQAAIGLAATWAVLVRGLGLNESWQWVAVSLAVTGAITRAMADPVVDNFIDRFLPWLSTQPAAKPTSVVANAPETPLTYGGSDPAYRANQQ